MIFKSRWFLFSLLALVPAYGNIRALIGFTLTSRFDIATLGTKYLRILTANHHASTAQTKPSLVNEQRDKNLAFIKLFSPDTAATEIYTLSLHDALPICATRSAPE